MNHRRRALLHTLPLVSTLGLALWRPRAACAAPREVHGASDVYAEPGLALAWAVLQAGASADPGDAIVVLTIELDPARFAQIEVQGRDPFGSGRRTWRERSASAPTVAVSALRRQIDDVPRTEVRLYAANATEPALLVYYVGVPDTTPEYRTPMLLAAGVRERLARARDK
ncbi:MAG: hypothetical protein JNN18_22985 [Rubrivivax sp.]|nr:hypothetical protein [Rubrivivax sp.]